MAFHWWVDDGRLLVLYGSSVLPSTIKKKSVRVGRPLTKLSKSMHETDSQTNRQDMVSVVKKSSVLLNYTFMLIFPIIDCQYMLFLFNCFKIY